MSKPPKSKRPAVTPHPDALTESLIQEALSKFQGRVSPDKMETLHAILSEAADNHPMAKAILKQLKSRPGVDKSGDVPKGDAQPDRKRGEGTGGAEGT